MLFFCVNEEKGGVAGTSPQEGVAENEKGAVPKVQLAVVELVETTIFSAMVISKGSMTATVITYWTAPFLVAARGRRPFTI